MKNDSLKSAQQHHNSQKQQEQTIVGSQQSSGGGGGGGGGGGSSSLGSHLHHPSIVAQNDLKLGLGSMGVGVGVGGNLSMMGGLDNKTNQDILKAVSRVHS